MEENKALIEETEPLMPYVTKALEKVRYGNLFDEFTAEELAWYAQIKSKRGRILRDKGFDTEKVVDDLLDAANLCFMAAKRVEDEADGVRTASDSTAEDTSGETEAGSYTWNSIRQARSHVVNDTDSTEWKCSCYG